MDNKQQLREQLESNIDKSELINDFLINFNEIIDYNSLKEELDNSYNSSETYNQIFSEFSGTNFDIILLEEPSKYINNEFVKNVRPQSYEENDYKLSYKNFLAYEPFLLDEPKLINGYEVINIGYFKDDFKIPYLSLTAKEGIWMEITPHEVNTMKPHVDRVHGNVLVFGLGLGYFPYMASLKPEVKSITVIEKDPKVIEIFMQHIAPLIDMSKIKILQGDALETSVNSDTNFVFTDIYRDQNDGLELYLNLAMKEDKNIQYLYWIENSFLIIIRRYLICYFINSPIKNKISKILYKNIKDFDINKINDLKYIKEYIRKI